MPWRGPTLLHDSGRNLEPHEPEHWSATWASFRGTGESGEVGVQVVVAHSEEDTFLRGFRTLLLQDPAVVARYATWKEHYDGRSMHEYRVAKGRFVQREVLAQTTSSSSRLSIIRSAGWQPGACGTERQVSGSCRREPGQQEDMTARPRAGAMTASPCRPGSAQREPLLGHNTGHGGGDRMRCRIGGCPGQQVGRRARLPRVLVAISRSSTASYAGRPLLSSQRIQGRPHNAQLFGKKPRCRRRM